MLVTPKHTPAPTPAPAQFTNEQEWFSTYELRPLIKNTAMVLKECMEILTPSTEGSCLSRLLRLLLSTD